MSKEILNKHFDATRILSEIAFQLYGMANAFKITGNEVMGEELSVIGSIIEKQTKNANQAFGEMINDRYKQSQETSGLLLKAALAGAGMKFEEKEE